MGRLLVSELDKLLYGPERVEKLNKFYDKVDEINEENRDKMPLGIHLNKTFGLNLADKNDIGIEFHEEFNIDQEIMDEVFNQFQEILLTKL